MRKLILAAAVFVLLRLVCAGADSAMHSYGYTTRDGLAGNSVRTVYQDSEGFLWFGSFDGLTRYDGHSFRIMEPDSASARYWTDRDVKKISEDCGHRLWLVTNSGRVACFDKLRECFIDYTGSGEWLEQYNSVELLSDGGVLLWHPENGCRRIWFDGREPGSEIIGERIGKLPSDRVRSVSETSDGALWICTSDGAVRIKDGVYRRYAEGEDCCRVTESACGPLLLTGSGKILSAGDGVTELLCRLKLKKSSARLVPDDCYVLRDTLVILSDTGFYAVSLPDGRQVDPPYDTGRVNKTSRDEAGDLWWSENSGVISFVEIDSGEMHHLALMDRQRLEKVGIERFSVTAAPDGRKWISLFGGGLFSFDPKTGALEHFCSRVDGGGEISSDYLLCVKSDRYGNIWTGSEYQGLNMLVPLNVGVKYHYPADSTLTDRSNTIRMVRNVDGYGVFAASRNGRLYLYDGNLDSCSVFMDSSPVIDVVKDTSGRLWFGTRGGGIMYEGKWYGKRSGDADALSDNNVYDLHMDRKGRIWIATFAGGLNVARNDGGKISFGHCLSGNPALRYARCIEEDNAGRLWVGTNGGIVVFRPDSLLADPSHFELLSADNGRLPGNEVRTIYTDSSGRVWCSLAGIGIAWCMPPENLSDCGFHTIKVSNGLGNNVVQSILEDADGNLWFGTEYGLSVLDPKSWHIENHLFASTDPGNVFLENSADVLPGGRLAFGANHGLAVIEPQKVSGHYPLPEVRFTSLWVNGELRLPYEKSAPSPASVSYADRLDLGYDDNSLRLNFSAMVPDDASDVLYSYRLHPSDNDFSEPQTSNSVQFTGLSPGNYTLYVKAMNTSGQWGPASSLDISVAEPFWRSPVAVILYVFVAFAAAAAVYRELRLRDKVRMEKRATEAKLAFFTNVSHEFRTPLTLIRNVEEKFASALSDRPDLGPSLRILGNNVGRMLRLVNQLLEFRKVQEGAFRPRSEKLRPADLLRTFAADFGDMADTRGISIVVETADDPGEVLVDAAVLDRAFYNLLSNAIKYSWDGSSVRVVLSSEDGGVSVEVLDSGKGIPEDKRKGLFTRFASDDAARDSMGIGLYISHQLVNAAGGRLEYRPNGCGSAFRIWLPVLSAGESPDSDAECMRVLREESAASASGGTREAKGSGKSVLVIEDNADIRNWLVSELSPEYSMSAASDGLSGLRAAREAVPDMIICDILMPGMNGYDVVRTLKEDFSTSHIPIVLMTALCSEEDEIRGRDCGADSYIRKPFSLKLLRANIEQILRSRETLRLRWAGHPESSADARSPLPPVSRRDEEFLARFRGLIEQGLPDAGFSTDDLPPSLGVSRTVFYKKVRSLLSCSPNEFLRECRMSRAAELLRESTLNISEISYSVGIEDPLYFSRCFKKTFGMSPRMYRSGK